MARRIGIPAVLAATAVTLGACESTGGFGSNLAPADARKMAEITQSALESSRVGESVNWQSKDGRVLGTVTPIRTFSGIGGKPCRDFQRTLTVEGRTKVVFGTACRAKNGTWEIKDTRYGYDDGRYPSYYDDDPCWHCYGYRPGGFHFGYGYHFHPHYW